MKKYTLIMGLACCVSCDTHDPPILNAWPYIAPKEILEAPRQQAIIQELDEGKITIRVPNDNDLKQTSDNEDWLFTPQGCKEWNYKEFGRKPGEQEMGHLWPKRPKNKQGTGVLPYAIRGLLENAKSSTDIVVIVSTGVHDDLGISNLTKDYLQKLKDSDGIGEYYILNSKEVPKKHNECVIAGKQVYTLLHTTC